MSKNSETSDNSEKKWRLEFNVSILAIIISLLAVIISMSTFLYEVCPGEVSPLEPSSYVIIREMNCRSSNQSECDFPSDHIVIPLEWKNGGGQQELIRHPYLVLRELNSYKNETGKEYKFFLAGEYPEISDKSFQGYIRMGESFNLEKHSISLRVLIFHIDKWWDKNNSLYNFKFNRNETYRVSIVYQHNQDEEKMVHLFDMPVYQTVDSLNRTTGYWWDYFRVENQP